MSVGVASNRLVAKIASDLRKPDGLVVVPVGEEAKFLAPLEHRATVGSRGEARVDSWLSSAWRRSAISPLCRRTCSCAGSASTAATCTLRSRGIGETVVGGHDAAKSVSHEHTYDVDTSDWEVLEQTLLALSEGRGGAPALYERALRDGQREDPQLGVRDDHAPAHSALTRRIMGDVIWHTAVDLARREVRGQRIRLLGVAASGLAEQRQTVTFRRRVVDRRRRATEAADAVRRKFGSKAIRSARLLDASVRAPFERDPRRLPIVDPERNPDESDTLAVTNGL